MGLGSGLKKIKVLIKIFSLEKVTIMQMVIIRSQPPGVHTTVQIYQPYPIGRTL
jgi:hypothetical protein